VNYNHCQKFFPIPNILKSPLPPFKKGGIFRKLLLKSPFDNGGFRGIYNLQLERIYGNRYMEKVRPATRRVKAVGDSLFTQWRGGWAY
jgi:hypothetical protein